MPGPSLLLEPSVRRREALTAQTLSYNGLEHLVRLEGLRLNAYRDVAGYLTIGVGHLLTVTEQESGVIRIGNDEVAWDHGLTEEQAYQLLDQDADWAERAVNVQVTVPLTQPQFDALVSFMFNVGPKRFGGSTLRRELNAGHYAAVPEQLPRWRMAGGKVWQGLVNRRKAEVALWLEGTP